MILKAGEPYIDVPPSDVAVITVVLGVQQTIRHHTTLTRAHAQMFEMQTPAEREQRGVPIYWQPEDGKIRVWPIPDRDYTAQIRLISGMSVGNKAPPIGMAPVEAWANAMSKAADDVQKAQVPQRVERFTLLGDE